jgi:hypothetical protein
VAADLPPRNHRASARGIEVLEVFSDGFQSGDLSRWSEAKP